MNVTRRLLMASMVAATVLAGILTVPQRPPSTAPAPGGFHSASPFSDPSLDSSGRDEDGRIFVPAGARVVVGSLDQQAQFHSVSVSWEPQRPERLASLELLYPTDFPFDVVRTEFRNRPRPAGVTYRETGVPPSECQDGNVCRRFAVPYFPSQGTPVERFLIGDLVAAGGRTRVYLAGDCEASRAELTAQAHEIVRLTELGLRDFIEEQLFPIEDLDFDGHLTFVLCDLADPPAPSTQEVPIRGCVRQKDFLQTDRELGGDIIYFDDRLPEGDQLAAVLAHELAHAAIFSIRRQIRRDVSDAGQLPFWMNEGIAHFLEYSVCPESDNLATRIRDYRGHPQSFPLVIPDTFRGRRLRRGPSRAAALSFFRFAASVYPNFIREVLTARYARTGADDDALRFTEVFRQWMTDPALDAAARSLQARKLCRMTLAGTAFVHFEPAETSGFLSVRAPVEARIQVVIVDPPASPDRVAVGPGASAASAVQSPATSKQTRL